MGKFLAIIALMTVWVFIFAGTNITPTGMNQGALVRHLQNNRDETNLQQDIFLYHSEGALVDTSLTYPVANQSVTATGATPHVVIKTTEIIINGVRNLVGSTDELFAFKSLGTIAAGKRTRILIQHNGTDFSCVEGTEYDATTESAVLPAVTAGYSPIGYIQIINTDATFTYGTTNFNGTGVTTTDDDLFYVFEGTSAMTDLSLVNQ